VPLQPITAGTSYGTGSLAALMSKGNQLMSEHLDRGGLDLDHQHAIKLIIVYGVNKHLEVRQEDTIDSVKLAAMLLFSISESEGNQYVLKTKIEGKEQQLDEARTVEAYRLHNQQKVTLAAGTPFGEA
jgi:hypothetical protein